MIEEILIVCRDKVCFGIPTHLIGQILRVPEMTPLALSPAEVHGMCAVGGNITTAVDMNLLLGMEKVDIFSQKSRILTLTGAYEASALVVPEVVASVMIDPEKIEYIGEANDPVVAIYHHAETLIQVMDVPKMLRSIHPKRIDVREVGEKNETHQTVLEKTSQHERYLLFRMGGEIYAMGIDNLREILSASQPITPLSGTEAEIVGMMSLREELILIADLRLLYGFEPCRSDKNRILITQFDTKVLGLMIDEIIDIKEFSSHQIERFNTAEEKGKISGVIHDEDHLVSLVSIEEIRDVIRRYDALIISSDRVQTDSASDIVFEAVVFRLGREEYAINIERVAEIIDMTPVTPVAQSPDGVEGVVNIRGQIVTIGSFHRQLKIDRTESGDQKIIICDTPKGRMGFFVDSVSDVMGIRSDELHEESNPRSLFSHILHFDGGKRLVLLLDLERSYGH